VAKFHTATNHYFITSIGTISKKWFDGLPADIQRAVLEEGQAVQAELLDWTKNFYQRMETVWKEKAKEGWIELTAEQQSVFRKRLEGVDAKVAQEVPGLREWLDLLRARGRALK
jgi:TRAP-type C4-dicarboxylate transport system substrate-binding protein